MQKLVVSFAYNCNLIWMDGDKVEKQRRALCGQNPKPASVAPLPDCTVVLALLFWRFLHMSFTSNVCDNVCAFLLNKKFTGLSANLH